MTGYLLLAILVAAAAAFAANRHAARRQAFAGGPRFHSLAGFHGAYALMLTAIPALLLVLAWLVFRGPIIDAILVASLPEGAVAGIAPGALDLLEAEIKSIAGGTIFGTPEQWKLDAAEYYRSLRNAAAAALWVSALAISALGFLVARRRVTPGFRARHGVERISGWLMIACAALAILVTAGIVASLIYESIRFFDRVPLTEFLFGLNWEPQIAIRADQTAGAGAFGWIPVFVGTLVITAVALFVAVPVGLLSAIYLNEFAGGRTRAVA